MTGRRGSDRVARVHIIGGGLAGSEAAWQLAQAGVPVRLSEMRGSGETTPAHQSDALAEMVCSNSFRSDDANSNAVGLLHQEMRTLGSLIMACADKVKVPAGSALAVDRDLFAQGVSAAIMGHPLIEVVRERIDGIPSEGPTIIATGPLTAAPLAEAIAKATGNDQPCLLRCHRPHRPWRQHRHGDRMEGLALGQGIGGRRRQGLYQLPDGQGAV